MEQSRNLREMRHKRIITIPEFMVLFNYFFYDIKKFKKATGISYPRLRLLYLSGIKKIISYKKQNGRYKK